MAQIYISLGSNINKAHYIRCALDALEQHFTNIVHSSVFESEAVGFKGNNFYNSVVAATTSMPLERVCKLLKQIERDNGRKADDKKFSPRTLDLDLLFYDDVVCDSPAQLPRDEITKNAFVLQPLCEVAPNFYHPVAKQTIAALWSAYNNPQQKLWKVEFSNP
ncbi:MULTISPECIES: 2-amino-4-hydroxy-6-hydroxymethyldihydropteridine diphosphokinase [Pseudoalteromonas]|jgi:2-amino-4-hydroxy-6-hydroxymethyldihydropteridine diphosphokinase|uniref:2-amino-4-hydroxy-6-hydroxymethyldihydropteridine diphosphokinase n=1 Tax=Pseudoalteromonas agarivorans TaxID=176102 RepID=A0AAD0XB04_9GAMM|nr:MULTISPECIES: 2-amino-4-hydroxy-6-hydroxymethyldihydropteridine diphosphokinase [Pseudoalteromonas]AYM85886.1 2-amino-4-hydroxy-6-hydroxymethyldihydropteridine diphosphokinase [Pseudoalteromonas agarivorans]AZN31922.1 2-amino-4-hydroxy-6-hydroxymethyldihydropteridine diphosphokinase [Pseudoalteromonas sp. Xi13]MCW1719198.1 2-amino-4-hydroxy-6-hydroxymethyldihydropteridine diphosphokinase [Pseudoalteromonas sp. A3]MDC9565096.1 2-amino-4-hydroxy-6-hydroxymethyldihydropteridine diphosphokinase |tara:strand:- start:545 stop:1033 length:489 start_codon:yes stop_codon:yes gene_type:complete